MKKKKVSQIIADHQHFLKRDVKGWEKMCADLRYMDLRHIKLSGVNLSGADMRGVNLSGVDLSYTNLSFCDLSGANMRSVKMIRTTANHAKMKSVSLNDAVIHNTNLMEACLDNAVLSGATIAFSMMAFASMKNATCQNVRISNVSLNYADMGGSIWCESDFCGVWVCYADMTNCDMSYSALFAIYANNSKLNGMRFENVEYDHITVINAHDTPVGMPYIPMLCPEEGSFTAYKKVSSAGKKYILVLRVPDDARRLSGSKTGYFTGWCDKAEVQKIQNLDGTPADLGEDEELCDMGLIFRKGCVTVSEKFTEDRFAFVPEGILFFLDRREAVEADTD